MKQAGASHANIAKAVGRTKTAVDRAADRLPKTGGVVVQHDIPLPAPVFGRLPLSVINRGEWINFGLVSDTHLCCQEERLDALHCQYDLFESEGITTIFHGGNLVDGYIPKINGSSVHETSIDGQCQYVIDKYPRREGITTHFITGNDHEGWWQKEGFNFGAYLMYLAQNGGRSDLNYIGHVESDVEVRVKGASKPTMIRIAHPGGGCPYARSYVAQKVTESYEGGEKPAVLVLGHHHVSNYLNERNIHVINMPGFQSQTIFGRTKRLRYEIGGAILSFKVNEEGAVTRCRVEFNLFFDRTYYKKFLQSDAKVLKGHLVISR